MPVFVFADTRCCGLNYHMWEAGLGEQDSKEAGALHSVLPAGQGSHLWPAGKPPSTLTSLRPKHPSLAAGTTPRSGEKRAEAQGRCVLAEIHGREGMVRTVE